jgi:outer membrane scaffolding protein for murein synthesis (MipA/OmpV family)
MNCGKRWIIAGTAAAFALVGASVACAEDGFEMSIGAGVVGAPVYEGAREYYATPIPSVDLSWTRGGFSLSASVLDGLGVSYLHGGSGVLCSATLNSGETRSREEYAPLFSPVEHSRRTQRMLEGTPDASGLLAADATSGVITPVGLVGATAGYRPTTLDYPAGGADDETLHGFLYSVFYMLPLPLGDRGQVTAIALLEAMDGRYAEAWYSLDRTTTELDAFDAAGGLHRAQLVIEATGMITPRLGVSLLAAERALLADAAESPYTERRFQTTVMLTSFYRLW